MTPEDGITLVWRSDAHLADVAPVSRTDDWAAAILDKVSQMVEIALDEQAQAILDGGDFFHIKSPVRNTHRLVQRVAEVHTGGVPVYATIGNHDVKYAKMDHLDESPLGVLFKTRTFLPLFDEHEAVFNLTEKDKTVLRVRVVGIPYHGTEYDLNRFNSITKGDEDFLVVVAHCLASSEGGEFFGAEDVLKYSDLANLDPDVWCFGHWHKNQGITEIAKGKWVVNIGSLARGALVEDDLKRTPSCAILRFGEKGKLEITEKPLRVAKAKDVFDIEGRVRAESRKMNIETFVEGLRAVLTKKDDESLRDTILKMAGIEDEVRERAINYLEQAGA